MFNIGPGEIIIVALVLLIAVGPEQLPGVIRRAGRAVSQARSMTEGLRSDFMAGMDEIERATDPNSWAASAGPSDEAKPEKKHSATMADADTTDDADNEDSDDAAETDDPDDNDASDTADTVDADKTEDTEDIDELADEITSDESVADPKPRAAATSNGNGNGSIAGVDSSTLADVAQADGDDEEGESV